ncbi:hypothetical protein ACFQPF_05080 [Fictibacillus iocasae]|uniref:Uncharacterized protein n=1 Tax=Fictibacillus iocasae TaxID=2715437 RepID=A0ABW2NK43_9BACL
MSRYLKPLFLFATVFILSGVIYMIAEEPSGSLSFLEKLLAALVSFLLIAGINYAVYRFIRFIWRG